MFLSKMSSSHLRTRITVYDLMPGCVPRAGHNCSGLRLSSISEELIGGGAGWEARALGYIRTELERVKLKRVSGA